MANGCRERSVVAPKGKLNLPAILIHNFVERMSSKLGKLSKKRNLHKKISAINLNIINQQKDFH